MKEDNYKYGHVYDDDENFIHCRLHKEYELDHILEFPIQDLSEKQLELLKITIEQNKEIDTSALGVKLGNYMRYDMVESNIQFMDEDGNWI